jgi:hypothetical protein
MGRRGIYTAGLVGKPEGMRALEGPRHRWDNNIKMDLGEIGWGWYGSGSGEGPVEGF